MLNIFKNMTKKKIIIIASSAVALLLILALVLSLTFCGKTDSAGGSAVSGESVVVSDDGSAEESSEESSTGSSVDASTSANTGQNTNTSKAAASKSTGSSENTEVISTMWQREIYYIRFSDETKEFFVTDDVRIERVLDVYKNYNGPEAPLSIKIYDGGKETSYGDFKVGMVLKAHSGEKLLGEYTLKNIDEDVKFTFENRVWFAYADNELWIYKEVRIEDLLNDVIAKERGLEMHFYKDNSEISSGKITNGLTLKISYKKRNFEKTVPIKPSDVDYR
jgi:hypothetical protein